MHNFRQKKTYFVVLHCETSKNNTASINVPLCYQTKGKTSLMFISFKLQKVGCKNKNHLQ